MGGDLGAGGESVQQLQLGMEEKKKRRKIKKIIKSIITDNLHASFCSDCQVVLT